MRLVAKDSYTGKRADWVVANYLDKYSRSYVKSLFTEGNVCINKSPIKPSHILKYGETIRIDGLPKESTSNQQVDVKIIYEDQDCVVINKPSGLLTHSKGLYNNEPTVAGWLANKLSKSDELWSQTNRAGIVHRLDRATSGVMICAKNPLANKWLQKQFSTRRVKKTYYAIVIGEPNEKQAVIDMPIVRNPKNPKLFRAAVNGRSAKTTYSVEKRLNNSSLLKLTPYSGRTHQLRVHLSQIKHPIIGDVLYGSPLHAERLLLHAYSLEVTLPSKERKVFIADIPNEFNEYIRINS